MKGLLWKSSKLYIYKTLDQYLAHSNCYIIISISYYSLNRLSSKQMQEYT